MKNHTRYIIFAAIFIIAVVITILGSVFFVFSLNRKQDNIAIPKGKQLVDVNWKDSCYIQDMRPESFKEFILHNNTPILLDELYKNLDSESIRVVDKTLLKIMHTPDKKYAKYFLMKEAFFDDLKNEEELEYKKRIDEYSLNAFQKYKFPKGYETGQNMLFFKFNLKDANKKTLDYIKNKIVIDGGAYNGDFALIMSEFHPSKIYSFDILRKNIEVYKKTMELNNIPKDLYEINRIAIADKKRTYKISTIEKYGGIINATLNKDDTVESIDIDTFLKNKNEKRKVGFIHADVQGALLLMIDGMKNTIRKDRPILSLNISNSPQEFFYAKPKLEKITKDLNYKIKIIDYKDSVKNIIGICIWAYPKELDD